MTRLTSEHAGSAASGSADLRIAVVLPFFLSAQSSVGLKVQRTVSAWLDLGAQAHVFVLDGRETTWGDEMATVIAATRPSEVKRQLKSAELAAAVRAWQPNVCYTRFSLYAPALHERAMSIPWVEEINTDESAELPLWSRSTAYFHRLTGQRVRQQTHGFVCVTEELAKLKRSQYDLPVAVIANGIVLDSVPSLPAPSNLRPRLLFITGTDSPWQGIDKVLQLARLRPDLDFDVVGRCEPSDLRNIVLHGPLGAEALQRVAAGADAALGTLALHRKRMEEACPLKVREYLAMGIPTVLSHDDPDVDDRFGPLVLRILNTEDNVVRYAEQIAAFAHESRGRRVERTLVRHLDLHVKETRRLSFLRSIQRASSS